MNRFQVKMIDFHVHLFPDRLSEAIRNYFSTGYGWDVIYPFNHRQSISYLAERDISTVVYSNYAHRAGVAEGLNEWNHEVLREFPGLYCFCAFHPDDENALRIAEKALSHPRVLGFKLQLLVQRFYPHDRRLFPLFDLVIERNKRILIHVGNGPVGNEYVGAAEFATLMASYPDLPVTVPHMGALEYGEFIEMLDIYPYMYLDTSFSFYDRLPGHWDLDPSLLEKYRDRILYGSDFPNLIFPREKEIDRLLGYGLSDTFYEKVFYLNGLELIGRHAG